MRDKPGPTSNKAPVIYVCAKSVVCMECKTLSTVIPLQQRDIVWNTAICSTTAYAYRRNTDNIETAAAATAKRRNPQSRRLPPPHPLIACIRPRQWKVLTAAAIAEATVPAYPCASAELEPDLGHYLGGPRDRERRYVVPKS